MYLYLFNFYVLFLWIFRSLINYWEKNPISLTSNSWSSAEVDIFETNISTRLGNIAFHHSSGPKTKQTRLVYLLILGGIMGRKFCKFDDNRRLEHAENTYTDVT